MKAIYIATIILSIIIIVIIIISGIKDNSNRHITQWDNYNPWDEDNPNEDDFEIR